MICYTGDGSIMMNLQELQTIKTHNLPIRIFIIRNDGYSSIKQTHKNFFNARYVGCNAASGVETPDFREVAKAFGIESERIETGDGLAGRLKAALERRGPFVCEIVCQDDYMFSPKLSAKQMPDGSIVSPSLEDMFPFWIGRNSSPTCSNRTQKCQRLPKTRRNLPRCRCSCRITTTGRS